MSEAPQDPPTEAPPAEEAAPAEEAPAPPAEGAPQEEAPTEAAPAPAPPKPKPKPTDSHSREYVQEVTDAFYYLDRRGAGKLAHNQFVKILNLLGLPKPIDKDAEKDLLKVADPSGTGYFQVPNLLKALTALEQSATNTDDVLTTFKLFDKSNTGSFSKADLQDVLSRIGDVNEESLNGIMLSAGAEPDGKITKDMFLSIFS